MKNPPTLLKILSPIKMFLLSKTLLVTEVERSSQWKILSPWLFRPSYLKFLWRISNFLATVCFH